MSAINDLLIKAKAESLAVKFTQPSKPAADKFKRNVRSERADHTEQRLDPRNPDVSYPDRAVNFNTEAKEYKHGDLTRKYTKRGMKQTKNTVVRPLPKSVQTMSGGTVDMGNPQQVQQAQKTARTRTSNIRAARVTPTMKSVDKLVAPVRSAGADGPLPVVPNGKPKATKTKGSKCAEKGVGLTVNALFKGDYIDKYYSGKECKNCEKPLTSQTADIHSVGYGERHHGGPICKDCHSELGRGDMETNRPGEHPYKDSGAVI